MTLAPWDYFFRPFNSIEFPDLLTPIWVLALVLLVAQVVLYNVRSRQLHRHEPLVAMQEWLLWTGVITFSLLLIEAVFAWYFLFVLVTLVRWARRVRVDPVRALPAGHRAVQRVPATNALLQPGEVQASRGDDPAEPAPAALSLTRGRRHG